MVLKIGARFQIAINAINGHDAFKVAVNNIWTISKCVSCNIININSINGHGSSYHSLKYTLSTTLEISGNAFMGIHWKDQLTKLHIEPWSTCFISYFYYKCTLVYSWYRFLNELDLLPNKIIRVREFNQIPLPWLLSV